MNRTSQFKILYVLALSTLGGLSIWGILASDNRAVAVVITVLVLLIPGRVCGHYWRDFFKGRNLMTQGRFEEAEPCFVAFLAKVRDKPWIKKLIIFSWGMYTRDIEVMALNNLGAIQIELGKFQEGRGFLDRALSMDPEAPLPYYNLALIASADGERDLALELFRKCQERGFTGSSVDHLIRQGGELFARIEGRTNTKPDHRG